MVVFKKEDGNTATGKKGSVGMPSVRTLTVSKEALKKLSNASIDFDVRPHELVDAIVLNTNWETQVDKLVKIIKGGREKGVGSVSGTVSGPESGLVSGLTDSRVLSGVSRVPLGSESGPQKSEKSTKKTRDDPTRVSLGSLGSSEEGKT